jgi:NADH-ubiquinone oxidoreductase chain 4L
MTLSLVLFLVGTLGFALNRRSLLMLLISIELMLLAVTLLLLTTAHTQADSMGMTFGIIVIATAGAESAIGLGILVAYYRLRGTLSLTPSPRCT